MNFLLSCSLLLLIVHKSVGYEQTNGEGQATPEPPQEDVPHSKYSCENEDIQNLIVSRHDELRGQVDPPPANMMKMVWDKEAAVNAHKWANLCKHGHSKMPQRQVTLWGCGENLYMTNRLYTWTKVIQGWFDEHNNFKYGKGGMDKSLPVGHYTQLVWEKSFQIGCALAYCPHVPMCYFYVCHYCPAGNEQSKRNSPYAVGEKCANCTDHCHNGLCTNYCYHMDDFEDCPNWEDLCDEHEESVSEEYQVKNTCKETCQCHRQRQEQGSKAHSRESHDHTSKADSRGSHEHRSRADSRGSHDHHSRADSRGSHDHHSRADSRGSHDHHSRDDSRGSHDHHSRAESESYEHK